MIDFRRLKVWQKSHKLTLEVYRESYRALRKDRSLASQARRAAASISANIVEGCGGPSQAELARFLGMSLRSAAELDYHLLLARDVGLIGRARYEQLLASLEEVRRMLMGLIRRIKGQM
jgi:four helix bundle protein